MSDEQKQYWFNTKTSQVEVGAQSPAIYRVGPFATREEAENAPRLIAQRAKQWAEDEESGN